MIVRAVWNWLRYGHWTPCRHPQWRDLIVRQALHAPEPIPRLGEIWTVCTTCGVRLHRRREVPGDAEGLG
jgi:hypothetical protein